MGQPGDEPVALPLESEEPLFRIEEKGNRYTVIQTLESPYIVLKPIPVVIEKVDNDNHIASFEEANVRTSGDTWDEAIENLKEYLVDTYDVLDAEPPETLGPTLKQEFETLKQFVGKQPDVQS